MKNRLAILLKYLNKKNMEELLKKRDPDGDPYFLWIFLGVNFLVGGYLIAFIYFEWYTKLLPIFFAVTFIIIELIGIFLLIYAVKRKIYSINV